MLHTETVSPRLLEILGALMSEPLFDGFALAGGTSLALQIGHRQSIDIDLFGSVEINEHDILAYFAAFGETIKLRRSSNILICSVDGIKIDIVNYSYPLIEPIICVDGIRMISQPDIAAMKLNAIAGRGSRKDFIDLYFLLRSYSISEMMEFYQRKYPDGSAFLVLKSLSYFDDAEADVQPRMLANVEWRDIKNKILSLI